MTTCSQPRFLAPRQSHVSITGRRDFDRIVAQHHREPKSMIAARLFAEYPDDFTLAAHQFVQPAWICLSWCGHVGLHQLTDPSFDPRPALVALVERADAGIVPDGVPEHEFLHWLSILPATLRDMDIDVAKAVWVILSVVHQLERSLDFLNEELWWTPQWLRERLPFPRWKLIRRVEGSGSREADTDELL